MEALDAFVPRPVHLRYLRAWHDLLAARGEVTFTELSVKLNRTPRAVHALRRTYPVLDAWVSRQLEVTEAALTAKIVHRMGAVALRSASVKHGELYLRAVGKLKSDQAPANPSFVVNVLGIPLAAGLDAPYAGGRLPDVIQSPPPRR